MFYADKRKIKRILKLCLVVIVAVCLVFFLYMLFIRFVMTGSMLLAPNLDRMESYFQSDKDYLLTIVEYFADVGFANISIRRPLFPGHVYPSNIHMLVGSYTIDIGDEDVIEAVYTLFRQGYGEISKGGNIIVFQRWSNLDAGRGIVYSINGNTPREDEINFLVEILPLSQEGWYFYIEDFNEWRRRN